MTLPEFIAEWQSDSPTLLVHTSGSTGQPKPLWVEKRRMEASARITCQFLGLRPADTALLCLPLDYIAGKMMVVRSLVCGLKLIAVEPSGHPLSTSNLSSTPSPSNPPPSPSQGEGCLDSSVTSDSSRKSNQAPLPLGGVGGGYQTSPLTFAAMVPLQVYNSLRVPEERERLMQIRHLIIGGGAVDAALAEELKTFPHAVWSTYGMTETLSHIALRRLSGPDATEWYTPLEGVALSLSADSCLVVDAPAVHEGPLVTNDIAELVQGRFRILGRKDNVICSGGVKIQAEEAERLLAPHMAAPFLVTKRRDAKYGEAVVLLTEGTVEAARAACMVCLPKHWQPRYYHHTDCIPLTETGKPARHLAQQMAEKLPNAECEPNVTNVTDDE